MKKISCVFAGELLPQGTAADARGGRGAAAERDFLAGGLTSRKSEGAKRGEQVDSLQGGSRRGGGALCPDSSLCYHFCLISL